MEPTSLGTRLLWQVGLARHPFKQISSLVKSVGAITLVYLIWAFCRTAEHQGGTFVNKPMATIDRIRPIE